MVVLVLGGYGLIGMSVVRRLAAAGHEVVGFGRNTVMAARQLPQARWIDADIAQHLRVEDWRPHLRDIDAVVNAAGALQDGARDDVVTLQSHAMRALFRACLELGVRHVVQISATGAAPAASTPFMRSKAEADAALGALDLDWVILRPGLVLSPNAYGASGLLRALAGMPGVMPILLADRPVRTVHVEDVADAVLRALEGRIPPRSRYDLVESRSHDLRELVERLRAWLGFAPAPVVEIPAWMGSLLCRAGDLLGWLGWRPPLRTTALREIEAGIEGDPAPWDAVAPPMRDLAETLRDMPATLQERWYARLWLLKPLLIGGLSLFWAASGAIALCRFDAAVTILAQRGLDPVIAGVAAGGGAILDIALGLGLLVRRFHVAAAVGILVLSLLYLLGGSLLAPDFWLDPLGPYVKILPGLLLALVVLALSPER